MNYLEWLKKEKDNKKIKVIKGVRFSGKKELLYLYKQILMDCGVNEERIITIDLNKEIFYTPKELITRVKKELIEGKMTYVYILDISLIPHYEKVLSTLYSLSFLDLYVTSFIDLPLNKEYYHTMYVLPKTYKEFYDFSSHKELVTVKSYIRKGLIQFSNTTFLSILREDTLYNDILLSVMQSFQIIDEQKLRNINNIPLLKAIADILIRRSGTIVNNRTITSILKNKGLNVSSHTVRDYIKSLTYSFLFYNCPLYDINKCEVLETHKKYYLSLFNLPFFLYTTLPFKEEVYNEVIIYFTLLYNGFNIFHCRINNEALSFMCEKNGEKTFIQLVNNEEELKEKLLVLKKVCKKYKRILLISYNKDIYINEDIKVMKLKDFLIS